MAQKIVNHWYRYPFSNAYGTMCGRKITIGINMAQHVKKVTCESCKSALKISEKRRKQREIISLTLGI